MHDLFVENKFKVTGYASWQILRNGIIIETAPMAKNLILPSGVSYMFSNAQITGAGLLDMLKCAHVGTSSVAVNSSQTGLQSWSKSSNSYVYGQCGTVWNKNTGTIAYTRTYDFSEESAPITYRECCVGINLGSDWGTTTALNRLLFPVPPVLASGDQLRLTYTLYVTITPYAISTTPPVITGWDTTGENRLDVLFPATNNNSVFSGSTVPIGEILVDGTHGKGQFQGLNGATGLNWDFGESQFPAWADFGTITTKTSGTAPTNAPTRTYATGAGYLDITYTWAPNAWNSNVNCYWFLLDGFLMKFASAQLKATDKRLRLTRRFTLE